MCLNAKYLVFATGKQLNPNRILITQCYQCDAYLMPADAHILYDHMPGRQAATQYV